MRPFTTLKWSMLIHLVIDKISEIEARADFSTSRTLKQEANQYRALRYELDVCWEEARKDARTQDPIHK